LKSKIILNKEILNTLILKKQNKQKQLAVYVFGSSGHDWWGSIFA